MILWDLVSATWPGSNSPSQGDQDASRNRREVSSEERQACGEITPHFTACLGAGNQLRMNLIAARALLALAAYHLATHERPEAAGRR